MESFIIVRNNILQRKLRSVTTVIIIALAVIMFVVSSSIGKNIRDTAKAELMGSTPKNEITVQSLNFDEKLTINDIRTLQAIDNISGASPFLSIFTGISSSDETFNESFSAASCLGMADSLTDEAILSRSSSVTTPSVMVPDVFPGTDKAYFGEKLLGKTMTFSYTVKGEEEKIITFERPVGAVYNSSKLSVPDNSILFSFGDLMDIIAEAEGKTEEAYMRSAKFDYVNVYVSDTGKTDETMQAIRSCGYAAADIGSKAAETPGIVKYIMWIGGGIGAAVLLFSCLSIASNMVQAIDNRKKEIGILKAIGYTNGKIRNLFFLEVIILGTASIVIGIILSVLLVLGLNGYVNDLLNTDMSARIDMKSVLLSTVLGIAVPLLAILIPLMKISRINAAVTLKGD